LQYTGLVNATVKLYPETNSYCKHFICPSFLISSLAFFFVFLSQIKTNGTASDGRFSPSLSFDRKIIREGFIFTKPIPFHLKPMHGSYI